MHNLTCVYTFACMYVCMYTYVRLYVYLQRGKSICTQVRVCKCISCCMHLTLNPKPLSNSSAQTTVTATLRGALSQQPGIGIWVPVGVPLKMKKDP